MKNKLRPLYVKPHRKNIYMKKKSILVHIKQKKKDPPPPTIATEKQNHYTHYVTIPTNWHTKPQTERPKNN